MEQGKNLLNYKKLGKVVKVKLKGIDELVKVDVEISNIISKMSWEKIDDVFVTKMNGETISLLQICLDTKQELSLEQKVSGDNYTKANIKINLGDIEYDEELEGYWACGMLYETVDSAVYVYKAYLDKKTANSMDNGKNETLLDFVERKQSKEGIERVVFIKN